LGVFDVKFTTWVLVFDKRRALSTLVCVWSWRNQWQRIAKKCCLCTIQGTG